jgi:membrane-bound lytic murein transglycosylase A
MGVLSIPLQPLRSLAVDTSYYAIGTPIYVDAPQITHATPSGEFHRLMIAHDVGSAIKGSERGDIFFGSGDSAGRAAGVTKQPGHLYALLPVERSHAHKTASEGP